jgi:hypothetical protein
VCGACGTLEGLDKYSLDESGRLDASTMVSADDGGATVDAPDSDVPDAAGPAPDEGTPADDASIDAPAPPPVDASDGAAPPAEGGADCTCVAAAPSGWQGYVQLAWGDAGASACAAPYGVAQSRVVAGADAGTQCSACTCSTPASGPISCQVQLGSAGLLCANETLTAAPQGFCAVPPNAPNGDAYGPTPIVAPVGTCAPSGGVATKLPVQTTSATVCAAADGGISAECGSGQLCVPSPAARAPAMATKLCIYRSGVQSCPSAYPEVHVVSTGTTDSRGCAACGCAPPGCPTDGYVSGYASPNCTGNVAFTFAADAGCVVQINPAMGSVSFVYNPSHSAWNGTCAPTGGGPTGAVAVDPANATTYCCVP